MNYELLKWDTDFFGMKIAEIKARKSCDAVELARLVESAKNDGIELIYLYMDPRDSAANQLAKVNNWLLADEKVLYRRDLRAECGCAQLNRDIESLPPLFNHGDIVDLAIQSAEWSRFKIDERFGENKYKELYKIWAEKSISGEMADLVNIHQNNGRIDGFITLSIKRGTGVIGLIAVDTSARGQGVGTKLIESAVEYCLANNAHALEVTTQIANVKACGFYKKNSFSITNIVNIYHV